jgi:hypothetical protein
MMREDTTKAKNGQENGENAQGKNLTGSGEKALKWD